MSDKRKYARGLSFVQAGFEACWTNAKDLVRSAGVLLNAGLHAPALSLSVLALEEMGKLCLVDGLLFAKNDGHKYDFFQQGLRRHNVKLAAANMISFFSIQVASTDPRFTTDDAFKVALRIGHENWKSCRQNVLDIAGESEIQFLDGWKQHGFYAGLTKKSNQLRPPRAVIDQDVTDAVYQFAHMSMSNLAFALSNDNLQRHMDRAQRIRSKLSEAEHELLEEFARNLFADHNLNTDDV